MGASGWDGGGDARRGAVTHLVVVQRQAQLALVGAQVVLHEVGVLGRETQPLRRWEVAPRGPLQPRPARGVAAGLLCTWGPGADRGRPGRAPRPCGATAGLVQTESNWQGQGPTVPLRQATGRDRVYTVAAGPTAVASLGLGGDGAPAARLLTRPPGRGHPARLPSAAAQTEPVREVREGPAEPRSRESCGRDRRPSGNGGGGGSRAAGFKP